MIYAGTGLRRLILASGSPRRRQLLSLLGVPFVVKAIEVDERALPEEPPSEMVLRVAQAKAFSVTGIRPDELVIAADTVVVRGGQTLGKPQDAEHAVRMLRDLRGQVHTVYTGLAVWHAVRRRMLTELAETKVWMRNYSDEEVYAYVSSGDPMDKAGAYAIQHPGFDPVARVEGCWLNVMGLPLCHLTRALDQAGLVVPADVPGACQAFNQRACAVAIDTLRR
jgi:septum formation protein